MPLWFIKARTALALGLPNIARALGYRIGVRTGMHPVRHLRGDVPQGPFFRPALTDPVRAPAVRGWRDQGRLFSLWPVAVGDPPPDWLANPLTGQRVPEPNRPWWRIPDFDPAVGDIKLIWELSRMDWVLAFAQLARQGDVGALARLEVWLADWCQNNPPYHGPNWKCGQEASIRVMHLSCASLLLGHTAKDLLPGLHDLLVVHLQRIVPTLQYAVAQDNNHGTSEAAALFIGGSWLEAVGDARGSRWAAVGRELLESRACRLIGSCGSFSQYSLNYHRVMLDSFSLAELWRRHVGAPAFSARWQSRASASAQWLRHFVNPYDGDGPNLGANDGARLLQLADTPYRDYRSSVQLATVLFCGQRAYSEDGAWNHALYWLGVKIPDRVAPPASDYDADDGGFAILRRGPVMAMLRYPRFRFRPSQADALHLDFWLYGDNLLRDAGTFSYNCEPQWLDYFGGTSSHNTVQFDGRDQMPRIGRFMFGDWLQTCNKYGPIRGESVTRFSATYCDGEGASHSRLVELADTRLVVTDDVAGFKRKAVLRWRLIPRNWDLSVGPTGAWLGCPNDGDRLGVTVTASVPIVRCELVQGWESRHYLEMMPLPVLEIEIGQPGTLTTELDWTV